MIRALSGSTRDITTAEMVDAFCNWTACGYTETGVATAVDVEGAPASGTVHSGVGPALVPELKDFTASTTPATTTPMRTMTATDQAIGLRTSVTVRGQVQRAGQASSGVTGAGGAG